MLVKMRKLSAIPLLFSMVSKASAHCPLCTVGIAAVAGGATILGVKTQVIGLFAGALAISTALWIANAKNLRNHKKLALATLSYLATVLPLYQLMPGFWPVYVSIAGDYGSLLNRTYLVSTFISGSLIGAFTVAISPMLSKAISRLRNGRTMPFQGVILTLALLIVISIALQSA